MGLSGKQPGLLVAVILPALLSTTVVIVRTTRKMKRLPQYISKSGALTSEILLVLSVISGWVSGAFVLASVYYGFGRHEESILREPNGMHNLVRASFWQTTGYDNYNLDQKLCFIQAHVFISFQRWVLLSFSGRPLSMLMNASGVFQTLFGILCIIGVFAKCTPIEANWDPSVKGNCWPQDSFLGLNYTSSALTFVSYIIQAWIPIHFALRLEKGKLSRREWIALLILAFWNVVAGVLALVKLGFLHLYVEMIDPTYSRAILVEIGLAENGASGIVPSAPEMWSLAQQLTGRAGTSRTGHSNGNASADRGGDPQGSYRNRSNSSELELIGHEEDFSKRAIIKTTAWETTSVTMPQDSVSCFSNMYNTTKLDLQPRGRGDITTEVSHV